MMWVGAIRKPPPDQTDPLSIRENVHDGLWTMTYWIKVRVRNLQ